MEPTPLFIALVVIFILLSLLLIIIILIQQRTKGGMSSVFGGGGGGGGGGTGAEQIFGSSGVAPVLTKVTAVLGGVFMALSLALVLLSTSGQPGSEAGGEQPQEAESIAPIPRDVYQPHGEQAPREAELMIDTTGSGGN